MGYLVGRLALEQDFPLTFLSSTSFHQGFILIYSSPLLYKLTSVTTYQLGVKTVYRGKIYETSEP
jgi:hypothetical protein